MTQELLSNYGYLAILIVTFLEGESIVILAGIAAYQGYMELPYVLLTAYAGSFMGDQLYFTIGRRFGVPLLERWPWLRTGTEWAFRLVRKHETLFILTFRFLYGIRNAAPFVIAMSGVPWLRFMALNLIAAGLWASAFSFGGYYFGKALERLLGEHQLTALFALVGAALAFAVVKYMRKRRNKLRALEENA